MTELIEHYALRAAEEFVAASRAIDVAERDCRRATAIRYADRLRELRKAA